MTTKAEAPVPDFIDPISLREMPDQQLRQHLAELRERRMQQARAYEASKVRAAQELAVKAQETIAKQAAMLAKEFSRMDALLLKAEGRINKILALRMQIEQAPEATGEER